MMPWLLRLSFVFLVAVPASARPDEVFTVTPQSQVSLGDEGDTFGMERVSKKGAVILLNPHGEACTLRFSLAAGEAFRLFVRAGLEQQSLTCDVHLNATGRGQTATFTSHCVTSAEQSEKRCPQP